MNYTITLIISILIILLIAVGIWTGVFEDIGRGFNNLHTLYINSSDSSPDGGIVEDTVQNDDSEDSVLAVDVIASNLMLNWVINCESSGRHEGVWGNQGEYGILQFKEKTFYWLSEKYDFIGDWKNQDDQIELFLLTSEEDKYQHWSCFRKYQNL